MNKDKGNIVGNDISIKVGQVLYDIIISSLCEQRYIYINLIYYIRPIYYEYQYEGFHGRQ